MRITWNELTVNFQKHGANDLLQDWRWLLGDSMQLLLVSAIGDMFLADAAGQVFWLDAGMGKLEKIAANVDEFQQLRQQRQNVDQWFIPLLIGDLIASGKRLSPGQCYGYKKPPILGGEIELSNFEPTDLSVHFSILGQIHRQVKDLPPGTKITKINFG
ncbi:MAG TPA: T6SS immunity protein Tdi1 domain-containing protein [Candidatus Polarisedimenticolia bacterium]|nr:T6SS immunity protein Tdi1 domain-containing protein [Candidatus Polarisedimenticolia bacterium]